MFLIVTLALGFWLGAALLTWNRPMTLLVLGADNRSPGEPARSDSILVLHIDPRQHLVRGLALPRDLYLPLSGLPVRRTERINAALFFGDYYAGDLGLRAARSTVSDAIGVPIDAALVVNIAILKHMVDALGGVDVYCERELVDQKFNHFSKALSYKLRFDAGWNHLDGDRATEFARLRRPDTDFGRMRRNQQLLTAVLARLRTRDGFMRMPRMWPSLAADLKTDMGFLAMTRGAWLLVRCSDNGISWGTIKKNDVLPYITVRGAQVLIAEPGVLAEAGRVLAGEQPLHLVSAGSASTARP